MSSRCFKLNHVYSISFNSTNFSKGLYRSSGKEKENRCLGAFHLSRNSGNSGRDMEIKHTFWGRSTGKFLGISAILERWPSFPVGNFRWKCMFHLRIIISYRLFKAISVPPSWILGRWRKLKRIELESNGTRYSFYRPFHGNFQKFLVYMEIAPSTNVLHKPCN